MNFITYAQNFEDVILWRALKDIENGFYIDIGAQDPVEDSVSLSFYKAGWRGVHAEPNGYYADRIREARPGEEVVEAAIGSATGPLKFYEIQGTGLSTGAEDVAENHRLQGRRIVEREVPVLPLSELLDRHGGRAIHWLKIDVEGMETSVIESWQPSKVRPWIVLVESTLPNTTIESFDGWEGGLEKLGYTFVYFDGLNRFYVHKDHADLARHFGPGPNFFDKFLLPAGSHYTTNIARDLNLARYEADEYRKEIEALTEERNWLVSTTQERVAALEENVAELESRIASLNAQTHEKLGQVEASVTGLQRDVDQFKQSSSHRQKSRFSHPVLRKIENGFRLAVTEPSSLKPTVRRNMAMVRRKGRTVLDVAKTDPKSLPKLVHHQFWGKYRVYATQGPLRVADMRRNTTSNELKRQVQLQAAFRQIRKTD